MTEPSDPPVGVFCFCCYLYRPWSDGQLFPHILQKHRRHRISALCPYMKAHNGFPCHRASYTLYRQIWYCFRLSYSLNLQRCSSLRAVRHIFSAPSPLHKYSPHHPLSMSPLYCLNRNLCSYMRRLSPYRTCH